MDNCDHMKVFLDSTHTHTQTDTLTHAQTKGSLYVDFSMSK